MADEKTDPLQTCEEKVEELAAENAELRESAESFGALAERLNKARRAEAAAIAAACPRCHRPERVVHTPPTPEGNILHCDYCGHAWGPPKAGDDASYE